jgi:hypothetical protein
MRETPAHPWLPQLCSQQQTVLSQGADNQGMDKENVTDTYTPWNTTQPQGEEELIMSFAEKWMDLEVIVLREMGQVQRVKCRMFSLEELRSQTVMTR